MEIAYLGHDLLGLTVPDVDGHEFWSKSKGSATCRNEVPLGVEGYATDVPLVLAEERL
jgi:hypothetical protein